MAISIMASRCGRLRDAILVPISEVDRSRSGSGALDLHSLTRAAHGTNTEYAASVDRRRRDVAISMKMCPVCPAASAPEDFGRDGRFSADVWRLRRARTAPQRPREVWGVAPGGTLDSLA